MELEQADQQDLCMANQIFILLGVDIRHYLIKMALEEYDVLTLVSLFLLELPQKHLFVMVNLLTELVEEEQLRVLIVQVEARYDNLIELGLELLCILENNL